jgi:pyridoxal phosphate enzyme (YggS family)
MSIEANLLELRGRMAVACRRAGRAEGDVALMAVSKVHPVELLLEAYAAGQRLFGENRVQEFAVKSAALAGCKELQMHLIGPLQSNKSARAAELFHSIDTVDSFRLAQRLHTAASALGKRLPILIEVKLSHEESKHGVSPAELAGLLERLQPLTALIPAGLMTVPPWTEDPDLARPYFRELRRLRDQHRSGCPTLTQLSMGMSNDFTVAIEEGSTCVRVGTALFGKRPTPMPG